MGSAEPAADQERRLCGHEYLVSYWFWRCWPCCRRGPRIPLLRAATKPNLDIHTYRRAAAPDEDLSLAVSAYNEQAIDFSVYRFALPPLTPNSRALEHIGARIRAINLSWLQPVRTWRFNMGRVYADQWEEREVKMGRLPPGTYIVRAVGAGSISEPGSPSPRLRFSRKDPARRCSSMPRRRTQGGL